MTWSYAGRLPERVKRRVMTEHRGVCHACGHPGATQVDHVVNVARWLRERLPGDPNALANLAPIHGSPTDSADRCPTCGEACHFLKTQAEARHGRKRPPKARPTDAHPGALSPGSTYVPPWLRVKDTHPGALSPRRPEADTGATS